MRDLDDVDAELRFMATVRAALLADGGKPTTRVLDGLLDERIELVRRRNAGLLAD